MSGAKIDRGDGMDAVYSGMAAFLAKHSVGGRLEFPAPNTTPALVMEHSDDKVIEFDEYSERVDIVPMAPLDSLPVASAPVSTTNIVVRFQSVEHFKHVHKTATEFEDAQETNEVDAFNKGDVSFTAWPLFTIPETDEVDLWVILVRPAPPIESQLPNVGESCHIRLVTPDTAMGVTEWWPAKRTHNNFASASADKKTWSGLLAFSVSVPKMEDDAEPLLVPLIPTDGHEQARLESLTLTYDNAVDVGFFFTKSDATFDAEMRSLSRIVKACSIFDAAKNMPPKTVRTNHSTSKKAKVMDWLQNSRSTNGERRIRVVKPRNPHAVQPQQVAAFKYLLDFGCAEFSINMFQLYPHMEAPNVPGSGIPPAIMKKFSRMNDHQQKAYRGLLSNMPCGLAFLPGGPGGGKTDWVMSVISIMQSKSNAKVLYMLDINSPLDDATGKYIRLMQNACIQKKVIRLKNFGTELNMSNRVGRMLKRAKRLKRLGADLMEAAEEPNVDFSKNFLKLYTQHTEGNPPEATKTRYQDVMQSLDEAAWDHYEQNKEEFADLTHKLQTCNNSAVENRALRREIFRLYAIVLRQADFIATTPCVAGSTFRNMFVPDLVVFDEAAHARELSTLIAIANFCPKAGWIFIGDHRQTQPTVKSNNINPFGQQLATSSMERAHLAGALDHQLLINHRAFGRLERLPSKLIYDGKMESAIAFKDRFPGWATFVRRYLENLAGGMTCAVPRLIVHLDGVDRPSQVGTSWLHVDHTRWTMDRVLELIKDPRFRSAENKLNEGTILLLAPYKAAITKYQEAIEELAKQHPTLRVRQRVEARTWDGSQGHEADIVGIDYVREHPTKFMDGMYRFNVGLTRARQGEWHLMHPNMPRARSVRGTRYLSKMYVACETGLDGLSEGRIVHINWAGAPPVYANTAQSARTVSKKAETCTVQAGGSRDGRLAAGMPRSGLSEKENAEAGNGVSSATCTSKGGSDEASYKDSPHVTR